MQSVLLTSTWPLTHVVRLSRLEIEGNNDLIYSECVGVRQLLQDSK